MTSPSRPRPKAPPPKGPPPARPQAPRPRGCLASIFLDITGLSFLAGMKKKLGGPGFLLAFTGVLLFMFLLGARIERYGHLGEHQYVMQLLPMAGCFSPVLALLMTAAFGIGDCLTNATYWLFPQGSPLNLYSFFHKPGPLLTWGAYARMDFITLPLYAILPGLGSRILYTVFSRAFHAGRARILKDGGPPDTRELQKQLNRAMGERDAASRSQQAALDKVRAAEDRADGAAQKLSAADDAARQKAGAVERANEATREANEKVDETRLRVRESQEEAGRAQKEVDRLSTERHTLEERHERTDAELRHASGEQESLREKLDTDRLRQDSLAKSMDDSLATGQRLREERDALAEMVRTGKDLDGRPLTAEGLQHARQELASTEAALAAEQQRYEELSELKAHQDRLVAEEARRLKDLEKKNEELLQRWREEQREIEAVKKHEEEAQRQLEERQAEAEERERQARQAREEAQRREAEARKLQEEAARAQKEREAAAQAYDRAIADRNAAAAELNRAAAAKAAAEAKVAAIQSELEAASQPPAGQGAAGTGRRPPRRPDAQWEAIRQYDQAMYAELARRARERELLIREMQIRNGGLLPNGLGGEVAGVGSLAAEGLGGLGAAVAGAAAGGIVGAGLVHGHMWAEYNPIRQIVHPSHTADVSCYKMDVGYLDANLSSGVSSSSAVAPGISVVGADTGGLPPAGGAAGTAPGSGPPPPGGSFLAPPSDDEQSARDAAQKARDEAQKYKDMWEESEKSADKSDPNYQKLKDQYDQYIQSQEQAAQEAEAKADALKTQREQEAAAAAEAAANKKQWIEDRQEDLKAAEEEKAHLLGVMAGAQQGGFDTSEHQKRLEQLNDRISELHGKLGKEGADIDYHAADRGVIGVGKEFAEAGQKAKEQAELLDKLQKMQQAAFDHGMVEPGADGQRGDIYGKVGKMIDDLLSGKALDPDKVQKVRDYIGGRIDGTYGDPDRPPGPEKPWYSDGESWKKALLETSQNLSTCQTSDGKFSWAGLGGRVGIGLLTGGASEWVFTPAGGLYATKNAVDRGADGFDAWKEGMAETIKQELIGKAAGGLFHVGGRAIGGMVGAELAGKNMFKGAAQGAWKGLGECAENVVKEGSELFSGTAWKNTLKGGAGALANGTSRIKNILTGEEGYASGLGKGGAEGASGGAAKSPPIGTPEWGMQQQIRRAAATGDPEAVAGLYRDGGMQKLIDMQKKGYISGEEAKAINKVLQGEVQQSIRQGTKESIENFQSETGVKIKEVLVGDSGSSAKGPPGRIKTDADRTLIPTFDEGSVKSYASKRGISEAEAYDELSKKFAATHEASVDQALRNRTGLTTSDVDYKSYDRIGGGSGKADSYAEGFTNSRQAGQGSGEKYTVNPDGTAKDPVPVSGQTVVDQNQLNKAKYDPDYHFPEDPTKIPRSEVPSVLEQQTASIGKHPDDPLTIAKAVGRTEKIANVAGDSLGDPRLTQTAREIYENPGRMNEILKRNGFVDAHGNPDPSAFCNQGASKVVDYSAHFRP